MTIAVLALARTTFDVAHAEALTTRTVTTLTEAGYDVTGGTRLLTDVETVAAAVRSIDGAIDAALILFATFSDSTLPVTVADLIDEPVILWAFPEERTGGRLRLNSLCGMNLAGHALTLSGRDYRWLYAAPDDPTVPDRFANALSWARPFVPRSVPPGQETLVEHDLLRADEVRRRLSSVTVGVIGDHPEGFEPCAYDPGELAGVTGIGVHRVELSDWFVASRAVDGPAVDTIRARADRRLTGLDTLDQASVTASLRLHGGLRSLVREHHWAGVATRCWPECFTEFGGAACTPNSLLTDDGVPGCCEADVHGVVTSLMLQAVADEPAFVADLVDLHPASNTGVFWHCGNAPSHMAGTPASATVHSNRGMPLLNEFALKPGRVTIARLSNAGGEMQLVIGGGEVIDAPLAFSGTSGVVRFDHPVERVLETVMGRGLEHHYGIAYGDHHAVLAALASRWSLPVLAL